ncbi:hypothetical protein E3N88_35148 [Mikania micrantha]|uniref:Uncharacterized protein n=1 Tax=Mikania micrantha TaxID=192012 RepID=A0A5N6M0A7_9ASTR|nr:hypothetical protein E3N88_35148 [Mikania micrantha]
MSGEYYNSFHNVMKWAFIFHLLLQKFQFLRWGYHIQISRSPEGVRSFAGEGEFEHQRRSPEIGVLIERTKTAEQWLEGVGGSIPENKGLDLDGDII